MTGAATWQTCSGTGVMLFQPAKITIFSGQESSPMEVRLSRMSVSRESQSPESETAIHVARPPLTALPLKAVQYSRADSPSTVCGDDDDIIYTPTSSAPDSDRDWFQQLTQFFDNNDQVEPDYPALSRASSTVSSYALNKTDFCIDDAQTPCPRRTVNIGATASSSSEQEVSDNVARKLSFAQAPQATTTSRQRPSIQQSEGQRSLEELKNIETSPRHDWTTAQRRLLCILWRFYKKGTPDATDLVKVFNEVTGLELPTRKVKNQLENHLRLYGAKAYPFYGQVFECPLNDPNDDYLSERASIEEAAEIIGVRLQRQTTNQIYSSGRAANAKAIKTRRYFKKLMRRARYETKAPSIEALRPHANMTGMRLGGYAISTTQGLEELEVGVHEGAAPVNTTEPDTPQYNESSRHGPHQLCHLAFRVWDKNSRTSFNPETGFVSQMHSMWRGPLLPPPRPETENGRNCHLLLTNLHLNKRGNASAYVSVATSLIQVLNYATNMIDPRIAVINTQLPSLQEPHKQLMASDTLKELKSIGQAQWAKYKGLAEIMIWGDVPIDAIIHHGSLADLAATTTWGPTGELLLNPEDWVPKQSARDLAKALKARAITLDRDVARAVGSLGKAMGLNRAGVTSRHITEFVQVFVDGWSLDCQLADDIHTRSSIATSFAIALDSRTLSLQDAMAAFIDGIERGKDNIAYYNRRRPSFGRRKTT